MKKWISAWLILPAICLFAGTWPDREQLLDTLVKSAPNTLKSFRAETGEFGSLPWICNDQNTMFWLAVLWNTPSPKNPYYHDAKLLDVIAKAGERLVNEQDKKGMWIFRKKDHSTWGQIHMPWTYTRWIQTYLIVKDALPPAAKAKWEKGLLLGYKHIVRYCRGKGTHNIAAYHAAGTYAAGIAFGKEDWKKAATDFMHRLIARQAEDGYWTEHYGPVVSYNMVYLQALGIYYHYSKDPKALDALRKGAQFHAAILWENGSSASAIDERNGYTPQCRMGNVGFSFTPEGRWYMAQMTARQKLHPDNAGHLLYMGIPGETRGALAGDGTYLSRDKQFSMNRQGKYQWCISAYACKPNNSRWIMERQNHVELYHRDFGLFAGGGNTRMQPYYSSFTFGDPDTHQPDYSTTKPNFFPKIPLQWVADKSSLKNNTLTLTYGKNRASITITPDGDAMNVDFKLENTPDKPAMAHLPLMLSNGIRSGNGYLFPPEKKVVTGKDLGGKLMLATGFIAEIPDHAQVRDGVTGFNPYRKDGRTGATRMILSIPLSPEKPTARVRFVAAPQEISELTVWNGNMAQVKTLRMLCDYCKAENKDGALTISGKSGKRGKTSPYLYARIAIPATRVEGKILEMAFSANVTARDVLYIKGKTASGKVVFSCLRHFSKSEQTDLQIRLPLPGCSSPGFQPVPKQITAAPGEPVSTVEFYYAIPVSHAERSFAVKNIRLVQPENKGK